MTFYAHSGNKEDRSDWQELGEHLQAVDRIARGMGRQIGVPMAAALAGRLHDLGKYDPAFDARLRGEAVRVNHSTAGAAALSALSRTPGERSAADLLSYAILGHHAGLPDRRGAGEATVDARLDGFDLGRLDPSWQAEVPFNFDGVMEECIARAQAGSKHPAFDLSVTVRIIFSCLVDADFRDTEAFYAEAKGRRIDRGWPALPDIRPDLVSRFDAYMEQRPKEGEVNALRRDILTHIRSKAALSPGLFTLTVPTGGGKTLASLGFALDHAAQGHRRIIYAIPFTSVIDQTARIFREVLGAEHVLEHHSAIEDRRDGFQGRDKLRLAMEDWAAPVVVTTNVQLFESLFAARTSRARKLHNIAGSVIVLDEAQTLPRHLLMPCVRMIDALTRHWGCSIVLCTATQPALGLAVLKDGLDLKPERELAPDPPALARQLARATIRWAGPMDDVALVKALRGAPQGLVIVNGRRHALALFRAAKAAGLEGLMHLTTRRCAADRKGALEAMRRRLKDAAPCRVIATSLIEAGVDVDFPAVWRAEAGLDQIVQAAGRCNREGRRAREDSIVTVFKPPDWDPPDEIRGLIGDTARMIGGHDDPLSPEAMAAYFGEVFWRVGEGGLDREGIVGMFTAGRGGTDFAFRKAAEKFRMIESGMAPVIVLFDAFAKRKIRQLRVPRIPSGALARALQPYVVQVPPRDRQRLLDAGRAVFEAPGLRADQFAVLTSPSLYDPETGLIWEEAEEFSETDLIV